MLAFMTLQESGSSPGYPDYRNRVQILAILTLQEPGSIPGYRYRTAEVQLHSRLHSAPDGSEFPIHRNPAGRAVSQHCRMSQVTQQQSVAILCLLTSSTTPYFLCLATVCPAQSRQLSVNKACCNNWTLLRKTGRSMPCQSPCVEPQKVQHCMHHLPYTPIHSTVVPPYPLIQ
jgi:hypothetical protein